MVTQKAKLAKPVFYILTNPKGEPLTDTISATCEDCWGAGFWEVVEALGDEWRQTYWKRWKASITAAERAGYVIRKAHLTLVAPRKAPRGKKTQKRKRSA